MITILNYYELCSVYNVHYGKYYISLHAQLGIVYLTVYPYAAIYYLHYVKYRAEYILPSTLLYCVW